MMLLLISLLKFEKISDSSIDWQNLRGLKTSQVYFLKTEINNRRGFRSIYVDVCCKTSKVLKPLVLWQ
jgi:hypothetical protein